MKKTVFILALTLGFVLSSGDVCAQKKNVQKAKAKLNAETPDYVGAEQFIAPALLDSTTSGLADTWFTAGKIYYKIFDQEQGKEWKGEKSNSELMAKSLAKAFDCFKVADQLDQTPNAKGKIPNKFRKQIAEYSGAMQNGFINAGAYYFKQPNYPEAIKYFEYYLDYPNQNYWEPEKLEALKADTMRKEIKYYIGASASQNDDSKTALKYFTELWENEEYADLQEMFQFCLYETGRLKDSVRLMELYKIGAEKYPDNPYYARSLINEYLSKNDLKSALNWIDTAMKNGDESSIFLNLKGQILEHEGDAAAAEEYFLKAIAMDPENADAQGNVGRLYYNYAVEELDRVNAIRNDKLYRAEKAKMKDVFLKPLPYMEKAHALNPEERDYIVALRGIYYNLGKGYEQKYEEMDKLMKSK